MEQQPKKPQTLGELIEANQAEFQKALPRHIKLDRFLRIVMTEIRRSADLQACSTHSILKCMIQSAQIGLEPDSLRGHAYLVPYKRECTLIVGYRGMIDLAYRSGMIQLIDASVWYDCDEWRMQKGTKPELVHVPKYPRPDPAALVGAYCVVFPKEGPALFDAMPVAELEKIKARSAAGSKNSGPWKSDYNEMAKKSITKRLLKYAPSSPEVQTAISFDDLSDQGLLPDDAIDVTDLTQRRTEEKTVALREGFDTPAEANENPTGTGSGGSDPAVN
jgi:recombination protein RecT